MNQEENTEQSYRIASCVLALMIRDSFLMIHLRLLLPHFADIVVHAPPHLVIVAHRDVGQEAGNEKLDAHQSEKDTDQWPQALRDRSAEVEFFDHHPDQDDGAGEGQGDPARPEQMEWSVRIFAPEPNRNHVNQSLNPSFPVVFGHTMKARVM